ncbi:phage tail protein [Providencia huaxiensis]|uniref:TipJ family phage tail tip protein n=1 Tax=Providencia huaxiensis TaxID=2027290 RepID=UPI0032DBA9C4
MRIQGAKGGSSKPRTPVEQKDSLLAESTAKLLLAISEGEIAGGLDDTCIFLDDTPIGNADGSKNFEGVTWEFRSGSEHQEYIQGIPSVDNEIAVGMELKDDQPYVRTVNNTQLSAIRIRLSAPQFLQQHDNGDTTGYRVDYVIELSTDGAGYKDVVKSAFDGKTTSEYPRTHRIDLPKASTGWQVRVRRLTKNQNNARIADRINIAAIAEVIDAKLRYPNTALLFITFNARQFNNRIPKVSVRPKGGLLIKVPANYDPINRTYSGVWDGTFKLAATNNPAWVFYDLVLNNRYGCGDRIKASQIDKWDLYKIAQYCDELVPDGHGGDGKEPRFLCDVYIQSQESAYTVLRDIAAIFRGMTFWADNKVKAVADMPASIFRTFTNANIVGGKPSYSGGSTQNRYTQALVSFTDINNHSNDDIEPVVDLKLQRRYKAVRKVELSAIGCTRRSEANRRGRWALLTNANDRMISFATGLEGAIPSPGHIIAVADSSFAGRNTGGRISSVDGRKITLDRTTSIKAGDRLIVNLPSGGSEGRTVTAVNKKVVTVSVEYSQAPQKEAVWVVDSDDLAVQLYRVINISDNGDNTYTINGTIHNPDNYDHIDSGARIDERPITIIPPNVQPAPKNVRISSYSQVDQGIAFTTLRVDWEAAESAIAYEAQWRRDNGNWINAPRTSTLGFEVNGIYAGRYQVRVRAINASEISSVWASAEETQLNGKEGNPPKPLNLRATSEVWGITLDWGFDVNTSDSLKTELQYSPENTAESMQLLADVPYPLKSYRMSGLKAGVRFYFRARLVDKSGNQSEWTSFVLGESSTDVEGILDAVGDKFLSNEAGQIMQEQIDFNKDNLTDLKIDSDDFRQKVISIDRELGAVNEAVMEVVHFSTENYYELKEESAKGKASIKQLQQVQADFTASQAKYQQEVAAQFEHTAADVLNVQNALAKSNEAFAEDIRQVRADLGETNDEVGTIKGRVTTVETATVDLKQAQAKQEQSVAAEFGEMRGYLTHLGQVTTDDNKALVEAIGQTQAQFLSLHNESLVSRARIIRTETALATETEARAEDKVQIDARLNDAEGAITTIKEVQAQQGEAIAKSEEQLRAEINLGDEALQGQLTEQGRELSEVSSVVTEHKTTIANLDKTLTQVEQNQQSQYNETKASINELSETTTSLDEAMTTEKALTESRFEETEASISSLQQTVANIEGATVEAVGQLQVQHDIQGIEVLSVKASIRRVETVIATETHALAQKVEQLDAQYGAMNSSINSLQKVVADNQKSQAEVNELIKSEIGDNKAAIEKRAETSVDHNGNASSIFGIKNAVMVNGQYYEAQMMMSAIIKNGKVTTQIGFSADTFGIFNPVSGKLDPAFVVVNGQVVMSDAFINKATIEKIIVGTDMRSKNYAAGKTGTRIDMNNGTIEINSSDDSGSRMTIKNDQIAVYAGGKPKIVIGRLYGI